MSEVQFLQLCCSFGGVEFWVCDFGILAFPKSEWVGDMRDEC